jgi:hypothetical protein
VKDKAIRGHQTIEFRIGRPIDAAGYNLDNREQLTQTVRSSMEALLAPPIGEFKGEAL